MADTLEVTVESLYAQGKLVRAKAPVVEAGKELTADQKALQAMYETQRKSAVEMLDAFLTLLEALDAAAPAVKASDVVAVLGAAIDEQDTNVQAQVNAVMHTKEFQEVEAAWRDLRYLVFNTETSTMLKLRLLNATKSELHKDLEKAVEFDQSALFKKVYEEEYGTFGGEPYGLLVGGYTFGPSQQDMGLLTNLSNVAAMAHAPFIAAAEPAMFDLDSFEELPNPRDLAKKFDGVDFIKWRSFRDTEDSRYVSLMLPRYLVRPPYGKDTVPVEGMVFEEDVDGRDHAKYLWGNPAFLMGQRITDAFAKHKWLAAIRGVEGGGLVENMSLHTFSTDDGDKALKCPTETSITDRRENELNNLGFIALVHKKGADQAAFFGSHTANKPKKYDTDFANANAELSATMSYLLCASRFAHYIKSIMRDKVGSFMTRGQVSDYLNRWISNYVLLDDSAPQAVKAKYPLREARVDVIENKAKPGAYKATVYLKPHFQLEELTTSIRLVAELPAPAA
ncbi:MAG: EvpB family type VI secretion protein [Alphaproteobacteria bacterium RIFOXYD12_FULL_60_8]|nr:MAG: EvpB family type VI secretion protein [Alphaproteobacteria bacterium RIFOXYD12_FULL_60_8]